MNSKRRNVGLDVCRILSMIGIVLIHVVDVGGALGAGSKDYSIRILDCGMGFYLRLLFRGYLCYDVWLFRH